VRAIYVGRRHLSTERERGATATEYAILMSFIVFVVIAGITLFGSNLSIWFSNLANRLP